MIYFPFVDAIVKWMKEQGGWKYWAWCIAVGILGAESLLIWAKYGFDNARIFLFLFLILWLGGALLADFVAGRKKRKGKTP